MFRISLLVLLCFSAPLAQAAFKPYDLPGIEEVSGTKTGFFHVEEIDGQWWFVDPNGNGFWMTVCNGNQLVPWQGGKIPAFEAQKAEYGDLDAWLDFRMKELKAMGINCVNLNSVSQRIPISKTEPMPYTILINFIADFGKPHIIKKPAPKLITGPTWHYVTDIFDPRFPEHCLKEAKKICGHIKDDPWYIGTFVENERSWGDPMELFMTVWSKDGSWHSKQVS